MKQYEVITFVWTATAETNIQTKAKVTQSMTFEYYLYWSLIFGVL